MIQIKKFNLDEKIYDPKLGDGISSTKYIYEHYYKSNTPENYFISFTEIDKLGINPHSEYNTPIGIYTYPVKEFFEEYVTGAKGPVDRGLTDKIKQQKIGDFAPFAGDNRWIWAVEIDRSKGRVFDVSEYEYSREDLEEDKKRLKNIVIDTFDRKDLEKVFWYGESFDDVDVNSIDLNYDLPQLFSSMEKGAKIKTPAGKFWNITRLVSLENPVRWNKLFRQLEYICVTDRRGDGVIHENEKIQALFFQRKYFTVVDEIENIKASSTVSGLDFPIFKDNYQVEIRGKLDKLFKLYGSDRGKLAEEVAFLLRGVAQNISTTEQSGKAANIFVNIFLEVSDDFNIRFGDLIDIVKLATEIAENKLNVDNKRFLQVVINLIS